MLDLVRKILAAQVYDVAQVTPLDRLGRLSERLRADIHLKREDLQSVHSFKLRGAYNRIVQLTDAERAAGVMCVSAGNHAQGVALAAGRLGISATVVMPVTTPAVKVSAVRQLGARVILSGDTFDEASARATELQLAEGLTAVHPYDDIDVIAGQGTVAAEILHQHPGPIEAVFIPIGGGGLAAGMATYIKFLHPEIRVIGVEPEDAASMKAAFAAGECVRLARVNNFADGVAVGQAGDLTYRICRDQLDEIITVDTDAMCLAIKEIYEDTRVLAEPAGALGLAGLKAYVARGGSRKGSLITVSTGSNMNFDRMRHVAERAGLGENREVLLAVTIPEGAGSYRKFLRHLGRRTITEFNYRYIRSEEANIFVGLNDPSAGEGTPEVITALEELGYPVVDLSRNEIARLHLRYMVGGRARTVGNEVVFRTEFPERPGALQEFLDAIADWNITLFHYRNNGGDYGRVLVGVEVQPEEMDRLAGALDRLGLPWALETDNEAYRLFLRG